MRSCFIIMPFRDKYEELYEKILEIAQGLHIELIRADKHFLSYPVMEEINKCITDCDYIITVIGDNENANVFYELGISHSKKPFFKVLIFKDVEEKYTFDIQHIKQFPFSINNLSVIEDTVIRFFKDNENKESLENALSQIDVFLNNKSMCAELLQYLRNNYGENCADIAKVLIGLDVDTVRVNTIIRLLKYDLLTWLTIKDQPLSNALLYLYLRIVISTIKQYEHKNDIVDLLTNNAIFSEYKVVLSTALIDSDYCVQEATEWLISYFANRDLHRVDITRHKIEEYLVQSDSEYVNQALIDSLVHPNEHVREYCAEIIREKNLLSARENLLTQLSTEKNTFTARSIIDALVRLDSARNKYHKEDYNAIKQYARRNPYQAEDFIAKHITLALKTFG